MKQIQGLIGDKKPQATAGSLFITQLCIKIKLIHVAQQTVLAKLAS